MAWVPVHEPKALQDTASVVLQRSVVDVPLEITVLSTVNAMTGMGPVIGVGVGVIVGVGVGDAVGVGVGVAVGVGVGVTVGVGVGVGDAVGVGVGVSVGVGVGVGVGAGLIVKYPVLPTKRFPLRSLPAISI